MSYTLAHVGSYVLLVCIVAAVGFNTYRRRAASKASGGAAVATAPQGDLHKSRMKAALFLAAIGVASLFYGLSKAVPSERDLIDVTATITDISTVHRTEQNSNQSASSVNPFEANWWIELTVVPSSPAGAGTDARRWKVTAPIGDDELRGWIDTEVVGSVDDMTARTEAFVLKKPGGETLVDYDTTTQGRKMAFVLFLGLGGFSLLAALIVYLVFRRKQTA